MFLDGPFFLGKMAKNQLFQTDIDAFQSFFFESLDGVRPKPLKKEHGRYRPAEKQDVRLTECLA